MIRLCGPLAIELDGRRLERALPSRQGRLVFAYLVLQRGLPVSRAELIEVLWPEGAPPSPDSLLNSLLSRMRRVLPSGTLEGRSQLSLRLPPDTWIDVESAHEAPAAARRAVAAGDPTLAIATAQAALEIIEPPLLPDIDRPWVDTHRRRLDDLAADLLELTARAGLAGGELAVAHGAARRLVDREPFRESAHALLMEICAARGDISEALRVYDALRILLRDELGTVPAPAVRALGERLLREADDTVVPLPRRVPAPLANVPTPVGRDAALGTLETEWAKAAGGRMETVVLAGEAGIGKTTLAAELARRVDGRGGVVLYGRCDAEALVAYQPWVEALERHLQALPATERERWVRARRGALLRLLPGLDDGPQPEPSPDEQYLAFEAVRALIDDTAAARPLLLLLDDVHWADPGSLRLLRHLARLSPGAPMLVVACVREDELAPPSARILGALRRDSAMVHVALSGLDEDAVGTLVVRRTGSADVELARRLRQRTAGNPFFVTELLRDREERGDRASGPPPGVRDVVAARTARLGPAAQEVLSLAAIVGPQFDVDVLADAGGLTVSHTLEALDGAVAAALVVPAGAPGRYEFAHALVAETLLAALPMSRSAELHLRVADALERRGADVPPGEIAWHLRAAGPLAGRRRRVMWEVAAAQRATSTFAYEEAARHYEEALAAGADANRDELLLSLGRAHDYAGRRDRARSAFADAAQVARERGDPSLLARAALGYGGLAVVIAAPDAAVIALLEEALAALPPTERATVARVHARLAVELAYADPERAAELSGRAVDAADSAALPAALNARRVALWAPAHADERLAVSTAMIEASSAAGDHENALQGRNWRVVDLMELGRVAEAMSEIDAYDSLARALGPPHYRWYAPLWRTCLALLTGRWHDTAALAEEALTIGRQADDPNAPFLVRLQGLHALVLQRRFADVERSWVAEKAADPHAGVAWKAGLALLDAERGDVESARGLLAELRATVPMNANWHAACLLAEAAARVGDRDAAATLYDLLTPHARLFPVVARGVACYGSAEYFTGRLAATLGRWDEAQARLHRAVAENDRVGASPSAALALAALGDVLAAQGAYGDARHALTSAAARARATYMPALEARAERALSACPVG